MKALICCISAAICALPAVSLAQSRDTPTLNGATPVVEFDGGVFTRDMARALAEEKGHRLVSFSGCPGASAIHRDSCLTLQVENQQGRSFVYRLSSTRCSKTTFRNEKGDSLSLSDSAARRGANDVLNARARCYGDYRVAFRVRSEISTTTSGNVVVSSAQYRVQLPSTSPDQRWMQHETLNSTVTLDMTASPLAAVTNLTSTAADGESLGSEHVIRVLRGVDATVSTQSDFVLDGSPDAPTDAQMCTEYAQLAQDELRFLGTLFQGYCTITSLGLGQVNLNLGWSQGGGELGASASFNSFCDIYPRFAEADAKATGQAIYTYCLSQIPDEVDPVKPVAPPEFGDLKPICNESEGIPYNVQYEDDDGFLCRETRQKICGMNADESGCECVTVRIGQAHCGNATVIGSWVEDPNSP